MPFDESLLEPASGFDESLLEPVESGMPPGMLKAGELQRDKEKQRAEVLSRWEKPLVTIPPGLVEATGKILQPGLSDLVEKTSPQFYKGATEGTAKMATGLTAPENIVQAPLFLMPYLGEAMMLKYGGEALGSGAGKLSVAMQTGDAKLAGEAAVEIGGGASMAVPGAVGALGKLKPRPVKPPPLPPLSEAEKVSISKQLEEEVPAAQPDEPQHRVDPPEDLKPILDKEGAIYIGKMEYEAGKGAHLIEIYDPVNDPAGQHGASVGIPYDFTPEQIVKKIADKREAFGWEKPKIQEPVDVEALQREREQIAGQPELTEAHLQRLNEIGSQLQPQVSASEYLAKGVEDFVSKLKELGSAEGPPLGKNARDTWVRTIQRAESGPVPVEQLEKGLINANVTVNKENNSVTIHTSGYDDITVAHETVTVSIGEDGAIRMFATSGKVPLLLNYSVRKALELFLATSKSTTPKAPHAIQESKTTPLLRDVPQQPVVSEGEVSSEESVKGVPRSEQTQAQSALPVEPIEPAKQKKVLASIQVGDHGLPKGVPDRGPQFVVELMEASRRLGALARSKVNLRPGILGVFARTAESDKIYMGDIRNQRTLAHEIGHALDASIFEEGSLGYSQRSLAERLGVGKQYKKDLYNELKAVSEMMRGPVDTAYRKRAAELIADWFSLYAHDPGMARTMAPVFSKGVETALGRLKNANAKETVEQLLAGNVTPVAPVAEAGSQIPTPLQLSGQIPSRPQAQKIAREREVAHAAEGLVTNAVRTYEAKVQGARVLADRWRDSVPDQKQRNDVGGFVEGVGNLEVAGDSIEALTKRMTRPMKQLAKEYRFRQELQRQEINQHLKGTTSGEYLSFLEDYLGHFYADPPDRLRSALSRFLKESPHAKERKIPTLKEAVDLGLKPVTQDPAVTYEVAAGTNWRVATNRKVVAELKHLKTLSGEPVIVPAKDAPPGWPISNNPLIQRVYARPTAAGLMLWRGGAGIHPDTWRAVRQILDTPTSSAIGKAYDAVNSITRANAFAFSGFHDLTLRFASLGANFRFSNPLRGLGRVFERDPVTGERTLFQLTRSMGKDLLKSEEAVTDAAQHGLKFAWTESESYQKTATDALSKIAARVRDVPYLGKTARVARDLQQMRQRSLWRNTHDAFKIAAYHDLVSKALQDAPAETDFKLVKEQTASLLNDAFGGQEWQTKFWMEPATRRWMSRFLLAPDWTVSTLRSVPVLHGAEGNIGRLRFWGGELAAIAGATIAVQYAIYKAFGKPDQGDKQWIWDNEFGNRYTVDVTPLLRQMPWANPKDQTRHYVNMGKRPAEIVRWVTDPMRNLESKASRPVAEILRQVTGQEGDFKAQWKRDHETFIESIPARLKSIGSEVVPFTFSQSQFALTLPMRKGMTKYKAQQAYESVYEVAANPSKIKSILRGQPFSEGNLTSMVDQITDAATRNGVNAESIRVRALSTVRGHHYDLFFKALEKGDEKVLNTEADALSRLGATAVGLRESVRRRSETQLPAP